MNTYRMSYDMAGQRKDVLWTPAPNGIDLPVFARWVMGQEAPKAICPTHGMEDFLRDHGIMDIRSPT